MLHSLKLSSKNKTILPSGHQWLTDAMKILGYYRSNGGGVCFGVAYMGMQAILAEDTYTFDNRFELIHHIPIDHLHTEILKSRNKVKDQRELLDKHKLEIPAFFEGIELYQQKQLYKHLFDINENKKNKNDDVTSLVLPSELKTRGGITKLTHFSGIYNKKDLCRYFTSLRKNFLAIKPPINHPISLILHSSNHTITVGYNPRSKKWLFINANELPTQSIEEADDKKLSDKVIHAFSKNENAAFSTEVFGIKADEILLNKFIKNWHGSSTFKKIHKAFKFYLQDSYKTTWLYLAAKDGNANLAKDLIMHHANINVSCDDDTTPLYIAAQNGHLDVVNLLLANGAKVNIANENGTPLYVAAQNGHLEIVKILLAKGAQVDLADGDGATPLYAAAKNNHQEIIKLLLEKGANIDAARDDGATPLYIASYQGQEKVVNLLLEKGAIIDTHCINRATALYVAAERGHSNVVNALLTKNPHINIPDANGATPLFIAAQNGHFNIVNELLANGAKINIFKNNGASPLSIATQNGHKEIVGLLQSTQLLLNYLYERGKDTSPEYKKSFTLFGHTFKFGYSKDEKINAAIMLLKYSHKKIEKETLKEYEKILNNGELKTVYQQILAM